MHNLVTVSGSVSFLSAIFLALVTVTVLAQNVPPADCPPTPPAACCPPNTSANTWPQGASITVNIDPSFDESQRAAIRQAFTNWQNAGAINGSAVSYTFTYNSTPPSMFPPAGTYNTQVWNQNPPGEHSGNAGYQGSTIPAGTNQVVAQEIWLNQQITDPCSLAQSTAHEVGHGFGLEHSSCQNFSSVMNNQTNGYNGGTGTYGPTTCDNTKAQQVGNYPRQHQMTAVAAAVPNWAWRVAQAALSVVTRTRFIVTMASAKTVRGSSGRDFARRHL